MFVYMYILINTLNTLPENITILINKIIIGCNITEKNLILSIIFSIFYLIWILYSNITDKSTEKVSKIVVVSKEIIIVINYISGLIIIFSTDLFLIYLNLELFSISLYFIIYFNNNYIKEIGLYYFIISSLSSIMILINISNIYAEYGILNIEKTGLGYFEINYNILLIGFLLKLGVAPLHFWVVTLYEKLNREIVIYMSILPKFIYLFILLKLNISPGFANIWNLLFLTSTLSIFLGSIGGLKEINVYKIIGNSSIYNMGFLLIGFLEENYSQNVIEYMIIYGINTMNLIYLLIFLNINSLKNLSLVSTPGASIFSLFLFSSIFSLIGIPPFAGFFAKLKILEVLLTNISFSYIFLLVFIVFSILISSSFYLKFISFSLNPSVNHYLIPSSFILSDSGFWHYFSFKVFVSISSLFLIFYPLFLPFFSLF